MRDDQLLPALPFTADWKINENITEEGLEELLTDLDNKYSNWRIELARKYPVQVYGSRKEFLLNATPQEKLQAQIEDIQLSLWHKRVGMRSKKYSRQDMANTVMFLLLLKTNPLHCPREKEYLKFRTIQKRQKRVRKKQHSGFR